MVKILLRTAQGIREREVKESNLKNYSKLRRKQGTVYARAYKVEGKRGIRKTVILDKNKIIYDPEHRAYQRFSPDKKMKIKTAEGYESLTHEQIRYLYKRKGGRYERTQQTGRYISDEKIKQKIKAFQQIEISSRVKIAGKTYTVKGFSKVQRSAQPFTKAQLIKQATTHMIGRIKGLNRERTNDYSMHNVVFLSSPKTSLIRWVRK